MTEAAKGGRLISESFDYDGGRMVTVYVPEQPAEAIVYAGDGQLTSQWGGLAEAAGLPPTMLVCAHRTADETDRLHEYSPVFDAQRFAAHETFFAQEIVSWVNARFDPQLPREHTAVLGVSASGELALAIGLRHPDQYGVICCASPGAGYKPPSDLSTEAPRTYLVAGTEEPFFLENAARWAQAFEQAGVDVILQQRDAGHDDAMWRAEFPAMLAWGFRNWLET